MILPRTIAHPARRTTASPHRSGCHLGSDPQLCTGSSPPPPLSSSLMPSFEPLRPRPPQPRLLPAAHRFCRMSPTQHQKPLCLLAALRPHSKLLGKDQALKSHLAAPAPASALPAASCTPLWPRLPRGRCPSVCSHHGLPWLRLLGPDEAPLPLHGSQFPHYRTYSPQTCQQSTSRVRAVICTHVGWVPPSLPW